MAKRSLSKAGHNAESWARKKFISHDGVDENGVRAEVAVFTGYGKIDPYSDDILDEDNKNAVVYFTLPENLKHDIHGGLSTKNKQDKFVQLLGKIQKEDKFIHYRIESVRRRDQDRSTPFEELAEDGANTLYRNLVAVSLDGETWHWSGAQVTNPAEDKNTDFRHSAFDNPVTPPTPQTPNSSYAGTSSIDPPPYVAVRKDGTVNLSGYGTNIPFNILGFVLRNMKKSGITPDIEWGQKITERLLNMANFIQTKTYGEELPEADLTLPSHAKIRSVIFEVIETLHPITEDIINDETEETAWVKTVFNTSSKLWLWSIAESEKHII